VADLDAGALLGAHVDVERQRLHLLEQDLERLGDRRLGDVLALDDRLVGLNPADRVVGLDREHLLERVRGAIGLERPDLHLAEALATELRLAAQDRKSTRLNSSHLGISYAVFCLKKKKT